MIHLGHRGCNGRRPSEDDQNPARSDAELVQAARQGDKRAFVEIVARHQAMVCGIALGILTDFAASEDAGQEAFLTAWRKIHELREPERLRGWLGQIARNAALGQLRRTREHETWDEKVVVLDESPAPDQVAASEEEAALVRESLEKLPEAYRLPLVLYDREGQSVRAVAEALEISEDAVKQRLARGRDMLRDRMSGVIEGVLTRSGPTAIFTMAVAAAIGALAAPAALAGSVFTASSVAGSSAAGASTTSTVTLMSTSKAILLTTALVVLVCVPVGYRLHTGPGAQPAATSDEVRVQRNVAPQQLAALSTSQRAEARTVIETMGLPGDRRSQLLEALIDHRP
jgi:RNA polymerase sigma factor (sigma-70 family)